jgi:S-layer homology domain
MLRSLARAVLSVPLSLLLAVIAAAVAVGAVPRFTDVPATHPFHDEIAALASGGIAEGYPDGRYLPAAPITRQAMAAFLAHGLGRAEYATGTVSGTGVADRTVTTVEIEHAASGYIVVNASTYGTVSTDFNCPCLMETRVAWGARQSQKTNDELGGEEQPGGSVVGSTANTWLVPVHGEGIATFTLLARRVNATTGDPVATFQGALTAQYVPFDGTGDFSG